MTGDPYATLGVGYATQRRPDPRIAAHLHRALAGAASVVNVGAGTGSYEPATTVLAVEPSTTMIAQRPAGAAPVVRGVAEALPVADRAADAALAVLTVHHWIDPAAGLAELVRIADRQVVLTWDPAITRSFWLVAGYLPEIGVREADLACLDTVAGGLAALGRRVDVTPVPVPADCTDAILAAHWRRPRAYLDPAVRAAASGIATLPAGIVGSAMLRLAADLADGTWSRTHADLLDRAEIDVGYRLVVGSGR